MVGEIKESASRRVQKKAGVKTEIISPLAKICSQEGRIRKRSLQIFLFCNDISAFNFLR